MRGSDDHRRGLLRDDNRFREHDDGLIGFQATGHSPADDPSYGDHGVVFSGCTTFAKVALGLV